MHFSDREGGTCRKSVDGLFSSGQRACTVQIRQLWSGEGGGALAVGGSRHAENAHFDTAHGQGVLCMPPVGLK